MAHMVVAYRKEESCRKSGKSALYLEEDVIISKFLPGSTAPGATVQVMDKSAQAKMSKPPPIKAAVPPKPFKQAYIKLARETVTALKLAKEQKESVVNLLQKPVAYADLPRLVGDITSKAKRCPPEVILEAALGTSYPSVLEFSPDGATEFVSIRRQPSKTPRPLHLPRVSIPSSSKQSIIDILTREPDPRYTSKILKLLKHLEIPGSERATGGLLLLALFGNKLEDKVLFGKHKGRQTYTLQITAPNPSSKVPPKPSAQVPQLSEKDPPQPSDQKVPPKLSEKVSAKPFKQDRPDQKVPPKLSEKVSAKPFKQDRPDQKLPLGTSEKVTLKVLIPDSKKQPAINILTREAHPRYLDGIPELLKHLNIIKKSKYYVDGENAGNMILSALFEGELENRVAFSDHQGYQTYTITSQREPKLGRTKCQPNSSYSRSVENDQNSHRRMNGRAALLCSYRNK